MTENVTTDSGVLRSTAINGKASNILTQDENDTDFQSLRNISVKFQYNNASISTSSGIFKSLCPLHIGDKINANGVDIILDNVTLSQDSFVPTLTSNTSSGVVSGNLGSVDSSELYKLFDLSTSANLSSDIQNAYINYHFDNAIQVDRIFLELDSFDVMTTIEGSVDGTNYTTIFSDIITDKEIIIPLPGTFNDYKITILDSKIWKNIQILDNSGDYSDISNSLSVIPDKVFIENIIKINGVLLIGDTTFTYDDINKVFNVDTTYNDVIVTGRTLETLIYFKYLSAMTYFTSKVFKLPYQS